MSKQNRLFFALVVIASVALGGGIAHSQSYEEAKVAATKAPTLPVLSPDYELVTYGIELDKKGEPFVVATARTPEGKSFDVPVTTLRIVTTPNSTRWYVRLKGETAVTEIKGKTRWSKIRSGQLDGAAITSVGL